MTRYSGKSWWPMAHMALVFALWSAVTTVLAASPPERQLSVQEQAWIAQHPTVRIAFDGNFPPYSFTNESGELVGIAVDTVQLLGERTGIRFEIDKRTLWATLYEAAKAREIDVIATMVKRPDRREWFNFTRPYIFKTLVIMTRDDDNRIGQRSDIAGKKVALVKSYSYVNRVIQEFPTLEPYYVDTMLEGLNAVVAGKADAAITFLSAGHYLQEKYLLSSLKFAAVLDPDSTNEGFGVRADWPELASIMDKGLANLSEQDKQNLAEKWVPIQTPKVDWGLVVLVSALASLMLAISGLWLRHLQKQKKQLVRANAMTEKANHQLSALKENLEEQVFQRTAELQLSQTGLQIQRDNLERDVQLRTTELTARNHEAETLNRAMLAMLEDLQEANARYHQSAKDLAAANLHLQSLDRLKSVFIASMSHELRTPLNTIIGFTGMLVDDMAGPISDTQRDYLQRVDRAGRHLLGLVSDIIDVSKIEAGKLATHFEEFALDGLLAMVREQIEPSAQAKGLVFEMELNESIRLHSDRRRLLQCLLNLLSNAVKYTQTGSVRLVAKAVGDQVEFAIHDTGIGIAPEDFLRLYEPFMRLESHLKVLAGGSGLGLYLTQKLTRDVLGGTIRLTSTVGQGSTFVLIVPLRAPGASAQKQPLSMIES